MQTARGVEHADDDTDMQAVATQGMATKAASVRASLQIADDLFGLAGARSTANKYGLDRFWRNARTMASMTLWTVSTSSSERASRAATPEWMRFRYSPRAKAVRV